MRAVALALFFALVWLLERGLIGLDWLIPRLHRARQWWRGKGSVPSPSEPRSSSSPSSPRS